MKIFIDADACRVMWIAEHMGKEYAISVVLLCDTNHVLSSDYSEIHVIDAGADAVDIALINMCLKRKFHGFQVCSNGATSLLERHMAKLARRSAKHHLKGSAKRTKEDNQRFEENFRRLIESAIGSIDHG